MELVGDKVYFAWTDVTNEIETVKTAFVWLDLFSEWDCKLKDT